MGKEEGGSEKKKKITFTDDSIEPILPRAEKLTYYLVEAYEASRAKDNQISPDNPLIGYQFAIIKDDWPMTFDELSEYQKYRLFDDISALPKINNKNNPYYSLDEINPVGLEYFKQCIEKTTSPITDIIETGQTQSQSMPPPQPSKSILKESTTPAPPEKLYEEDELAAQESLARSLHEVAELFRQHGDKLTKEEINQFDKYELQLTKSFKTTPPANRQLILTQDLELDWLLTSQKPITDISDEEIIESMIAQAAPKTSEIRQAQYNAAQKILATERALLDKAAKRADKAGLAI